MTVDEFLKSIAETHLLPKGELQSLRRFAHEKAVVTATSLADKLVSEGDLTKFQVDCVLEGRTKTVLIDEYVVVDRIGAGAMGEVFKVKHLLMDRHFALKKLLTHPKPDLEAQIRFKLEIAVLGRLAHENIVSISYASNKEPSYLVMELVDGLNLEQVREKEGPLAVVRALGYIYQAAFGLQYAHANGIIHRDVKPANILLTKEGNIKVADLGLATLKPAVSTPVLANTLELICGTPICMAPELFEPLPEINERIDVYSLGVCLLRLITREPYNDVEKLNNLLLHKRPLELEERSDVSREVYALLEKMLAIDPPTRYATANAVIEAIKECIPAQDRLDQRLAAIEKVAVLQQAHGIEAMPNPRLQVRARWPKLLNSRWAKLTCGMFALVLFVISLSYYWQHSPVPLAKIRLGSIVYLSDNRVLPDQLTQEQSPFNELREDVQQLVQRMRFLSPNDLYPVPPNQEFSPERRKEFLELLRKANGCIAPEFPRLIFLLPSTNCGSNNWLHLTLRDRMSGGWAVGIIIRNSEGQLTKSNMLIEADEESKRRDFSMEMPAGDSCVCLTFAPIDDQADECFETVSSEDLQRLASIHVSGLEQFARSDSE